MRITNSLFYTNAANDYQKSMQELYKVNAQMSPEGRKIQNSFEDSGIYSDTMRLNYEIATLEQVKESSTKAQTYANNTDQVLNQFTDALTQFKTKLLQAANESNSSTSLNALANELEILRDHMISLGNTSINGQYLFAGTDITTKPFNDDGTYNGNNESIEAILGSGVKLPYNISGESLMLGNDSEYNKILSTNVQMYNQTLLYPAGSEESQEVYLTENDTINDLTGSRKIQVSAFEIGGVVEPGDIYTFEIDGTVISHTVTDETTPEEIAIAIKNAINDPANGVNTIVKATLKDNRLTLTPVDPSNKPDITTSVNNRVNAITSASITNTALEEAATFREQTITFTSASAGPGDTITWWDGGLVGVGNSVTINPAQGADADAIGIALRDAINADPVTGPLYTASYTPADGLLVTSNISGNATTFEGVIDSTIVNTPSRYSTTITDGGATPGVGDTISWSGDGGLSSYQYTYQAGDSVEDMLSGLVREIDTDVSAQYNAHYTPLGGGQYEFTVTSNIAGYDASFSGQLTPSFAGLGIANNPDDLGSSALEVVDNNIIPGENGTPASQEVTFTSAATNIDEGDVFEFTISDGVGNSEIVTYTTVANDSLENVQNELQNQLDQLVNPNTLLYGGAGVTYTTVRDDASGTLSFEITGNYTVDSSYVPNTYGMNINTSGTLNVDPDDTQSITRDTSLALFSGETIASFYVSGRNSKGNTFSEELQLSSTAKVSDLLEQIGELYGNTSTNKVVDVSMNDNGQIEIKDLAQGNAVLEFNIFGAIDRDAIGVVGNASQGDIDNLLAFNNVDIIEFNKSNFLNQNTASKISSQQDINNPGLFKVGAPMAFSDGSPVTLSATLYSFMDNDVDQIIFSGDDNSGISIPSVPPNDALNIDNTTTVNDLLNSIETIYGVSARLEDGQIYLETGDTNNYKLNQLNVQLEAFKGSGEGEIQTIDILDQATIDGNMIFTFLDTPSVGLSVDVPIAIADQDTPSEIAYKIQEASSSFIAANPNIASVKADGNTIVIDYTPESGDVNNFFISSNTTGATTTTATTIQNNIFPNIAEVQSFNIKENLSTAPIAPAVNIITIAGQDITIDPDDEPSDIAQNIKRALTATVGIPAVKVVPEIDSVEVDLNGKVTVTFTKEADIDNDFLKNTAAHVEGLSIGEVLTERKFEATSPVDVFSTFDSMNYERRGFEKDGNELIGNISQIIKDTSEYATSSTKLVEVGGSIDPLTNKSTLDGQEMMFKGIDIKNNPFEVKINFSNLGTTFSFNDIEPDYNIYNADGTKTKADDMTYQQLSDLISVIASGSEPRVPISVENESDISAAIANPTETNLALATLKAPNDEVKNHILDAIDYAVKGDVARSAESLQKADLAQYSDLIQSSKSNVEVSLDYQGKLKVIDKTNSVSNIEFSLYDINADDVGKSSALSFMANDAITVDEPKINFFQSLNEMIEAVRAGTYNMDGNSDNPRNIGIENGIARIDHLMDHITKEHTKIGSYSNALSQANERSELLSLNVKTVRSEVIDVDIGEAYMKFNQLSNSYQAMLSTVAKINSMTLLNYM